MSGIPALKNLDRRWLFLGVGLLVVLPLMTGFHIAPVAPGHRAKGFYDAIEKLKPGDTVLLSGDYDPGTVDENDHAQLAAVRHLMSRNVKIIAIQLYAGGPPLADAALEAGAREYHKQVGVDYVNLGYKAGNELVMSRMGQSIPETFPVDRRGIPVGQIPVMKGIKTFADLKLLVNISAGYPGTKEWVQQVVSRYHIPMVAAVTAVSAPEYYPYLQTGQLHGLLGGMAGAAEYEVLVNHPGLAVRGMDAQSLAHVFIALLIVLGNLANPPKRDGKR